MTLAQLLACHDLRVVRPDGTEVPTPELETLELTLEATRRPTRPMLAEELQRALEEASR